MTSNSVHLSIISPVYKAEAIVDKLVDEVVKYASAITDSFEVILVVDGSPDNSWQKVEENCKKDTRVKGVNFSRNFGQHYAITAGLAEAKGDWVIVMDCDLQDKPEEFSRLYEEAQKGFDIVLALRSVRQDNALKKLSSTLFYSIFSYLTDTKQDNRIANFGIYKKKVVAAILSMKDHIRYFPTMSQWVGFKKTYVEVSHGEREEGKSSYSWRGLFKLAWNNIISFSDKPLRLTIRLGILISIISGLVGIYQLVMYFAGNIVVSGFASLIVSIWFLSGVIIFSLGMLGLYIGKIFDKVKNRPIYIVDEKININE